MPQPQFFGGPARRRGVCNVRTPATHTRSEDVRILPTHRIDQFSCTTAAGVPRLSFLEGLPAVAGGVLNVGIPTTDPRSEDPYFCQRTEWITFFVHNHSWGAPPQFFGGGARNVGIPAAHPRSEDVRIFCQHRMNQFF